MLLSLAALLAITAFAQGKKEAVISGTVKDARTKIPLTEAVITLSSDAFEGQKFALTDSTGKYRINNLPPGKYTIAFEMEGYQKFVQDSITIKEGMSLGASFEMVKERKGKNKDPKQVKDSSAFKIRTEPEHSL